MPSDEFRRQRPIARGNDVARLRSPPEKFVTRFGSFSPIRSDGGNITFTAANDRFTTHKWAEVGLMPGDLTSLEWTDFEVVDGGTRYTWDDNCNCNRTPIKE